MAHQFSALHADGFVRVSHKTRERLRQVNMLALGLITEMSAHVDGFPVTLDTIIKRAKKPGAAALREAYQDLIDERLVVYVQYTLQLPGKRPYPSGTTVIAHEAITDDEFAEHIVGKFTPGRWVLDRQPDDEVRKVKVLAAKVRYWGGEKKLTEDGVLVTPEPKKKPGPKKGTKKPQPKRAAPAAAQESVELDVPSSTTTRDNAANPQENVELGKPSSTTTCANDLFAQSNVELGDVDSTSPSSLTRPGDKITNHTTAADDEAASSESAGSGNDWLVGGEAPNTNEQDASASEPDSTGAAFLRSLPLQDGTRLTAEAVQTEAEHATTLLSSGWGEQELTDEITDATGIGNVRSWGAFVRSKLRRTEPKQQVTSKISEPRAAVHPEVMRIKQASRKATPEDKLRELGAFQPTRMKSA